MEQMYTCILQYIPGLPEMWAELPIWLLGNLKEIK
uniref:Uncharacterized protein n=1 Tax=Anguilla anguilla TaxID=7936 RepID=A0A0E9UXJ6_ANGAN